MQDLELKKLTVEFLYLEDGQRAVVLLEVLRVFQRDRVDHLEDNELRLRTYVEKLGQGLGNFLDAGFLREVDVESSHPDDHSWVGELEQQLAGIQQLV